MPEPRSTIAETLRGRILRGIHARTLQPGDRLPSARELVEEFDVDHRLILAAYRQLSDEGLVEVRERGGVYVAGGNVANAGVPALPVKWFVDTLTDALAHEIPAPELHEWLRRSIETLRLRAVVVSTTEDQASGLARELRDDFGLIAEGIVGSALNDPESYPPSLRRADLLVTTAAHVERVARIAHDLAKPHVAIDVHPDLAVGEWALLLRQPVWAIVATPQFGEMLRRFFAGVRGIENLHILVYGTDDLATIPESALTYITHHVREQLGDTRIPGHVLPPARTIATESARELFNFIVRANVGAIRAVAPTLRGFGAKHD